MVRKNTIPDGWRNVSPVGQPIPGTRFIAFKVPLKGAINQRLTPNQKFTPKDLIVAVKGLNVELGLIIDLTYTTRYYDIKDLPKTVEYKKLYTVGHEVPDDPTILQFKKWVRKFLWENAANEKLIGVHCTNGINRTGYLICRYLIDVEGWDPETAIQVFGEARGHHMDGGIYLTDLKTQPMRSNLGMNIWDADVEIPVPNEMDGRIGRFPGEEFQRPEKRLRVYEDCHPHNDLPGQIQLREFDFINKGPGQRRKPYHDLQFQEELQPLMQIRERHFPEPQFYDDYQEEGNQEDLDFAARDSEQWQRSFPEDQFYDNHLESAPPGDPVIMGRGQRQRRFPDSDRLTDTQLSRGRGQRQRPFYDQRSNDGFQHMKLKDQPFRNMGHGPMRPSRDRPPHDDMHPPVGDFEFVNRGRGQRMRPFFDRQHDTGLQRKMEREDFEDRDSESRCRSFHDHQSYEDFSEPAQLTDFVDSGPEQRMRAFNDNSPRDEVSYEGYLERHQSPPPREHFPDSPILCRDYVSHEEDYNRNYSDDCPEDYRRICVSDGINKERKRRFAPYPSYQMHHGSSAHQKVSSASADYGREPQHEISREMDQGKRLQVVTIDYNYGLPLDYKPDKEDGAHYDLPSRERYLWN